MSSSRRDNMKRIFVGNLPQDVRQRDLEDLFYKFGKIAFIDLKLRRGPPFAFVEFHDYRDAEEAVRCRDGKTYEGQKLRVEFPRGRERVSRYRNGSSGGGSSAGGPSRNNAPQRRSKYRVVVKGLPPSGSWQDLKDHMREIGEVCFADVYKGGEGVVEFLNYDDMRYAIKKLNNTKFRSHEGESSYITLREDSARGGDSRSRSRSPVNSRRRFSRSSPPARSRTKSRSRSKSASRSSSHRSARDSSRGSPARSHSRSRSKSASRSRSSSPRSARGSSRGSPARSASRSHSRSPSKSPPNRTNKEATASRSRSRSRSRSVSKSPNSETSKQQVHENES